MKKYINLFKVIILILITLLCFSKPNNVYGVTDLEDMAVPLDPDDGNGSSSGSSTGAPIKDPITNPDFYAPSNMTNDNEKFIKMANTIIATISIMGTVIATISIIVIGIRYMLASAQEKAMYKETMIPYLIGAVMVFTIPNLVRIIYDLVKSIKF